jgi:hypothetical protein
MNTKSVKIKRSGVFFDAFICKTTPQLTQVVWYENGEWKAKRYTKSELRYFAFLYLFHQWKPYLKFLSAFGLVFVMAVLFISGVFANYYASIKVISDSYFVKNYELSISVLIKEIPRMPHLSRERQ